MENSKYGDPPYISIHQLCRSSAVRRLERVNKSGVHD